MKNRKEPLKRVLPCSDMRKTLSAFAYTFRIKTGTGIHFHKVALIDEEGNHKFITVIQFSGFLHVGAGGIASGTGFSFRDGAGDEGGQRNINGFTIEEQDIACS
jgi:hypothetical protein